MAEETLDAMEVVFDSNEAPLVRGLSNIGRSIGNLLQGLRGAQVAVAAFTVAAAAGLFIAARRMVASAAAIDAALREVSTLTEETAENMGFLRESLLQLSTQVPETPELLSSGLYQVISAGVTDTASALQVLTVAAKSAVAGLTDTRTAVDAITTVINAFQLSTNEAGRVADILFQTVRDGKLTFPELASAVGNVATSAGVAGITVEELGAAIATLTKFGLNANKATTALNSLLISIVNPTERVQQAALELGIEWDAARIRAVGLTGVMEDLARVAQGDAAVIGRLIPAIRSFRAGAVLAGKGAEEYARLLVKSQNSAGTATEAFNKMNTALSNQTQLIKNRLENIWKRLGTKILPQLAEAVKQVNQELADNRERLAAIFEAGGLVQEAAKLRADIQIEIATDDIDKLTAAVTDKLASGFGGFRATLNQILFESPAVAGDFGKRFVDTLFGDPEFRYFERRVREGLTDPSIFRNTNFQNSAKAAGKVFFETLREFEVGLLELAKLPDGKGDALLEQFEDLAELFGDLNLLLASLQSSRNILDALNNLDFSKIGEPDKVLTASPGTLEQMDAAIEKLQEMLNLARESSGEDSITARLLQSQLDYLQQERAAYEFRLKAQKEGIDLTQFEADEIERRNELSKEFKAILAEIATGYEGVAASQRLIADETSGLVLISKESFFDLASAVEQVTTKTDDWREGLNAAREAIKRSGLTTRSFVSQLRKEGLNALADWIESLLAAELATGDLGDVTEETKTDINQLAAAMAQGLRSVLNFGQAIGALGDDAVRTLGALTELGQGVFQFLKQAANPEVAINPLAIASIVGGGLNFLSSLFGGGDSEADRRAESLQETLDDNVAALRDLNQRLGAFADALTGFSGDFIGGIRNALTGLNISDEIRLALEAFPDFTSKLIQREFLQPLADDVYAALGEVGLGLADLEAAASALGIEIPQLIDLLAGAELHLDEMNAALDQADQLFEALANRPLDEAFAGYQGQLEALRLELELFDVTNPIDQLKLMQETLREFGNIEVRDDLPAEVQGAITDLLTADPSTPEGRQALDDAIKTIFEAIQAGILTFGDLGGLSLTDLTNLLGEWEGILDGFVDAAADSTENISATNKITTEQADLMIALDQTRNFYLREIRDSMEDFVLAPTFDEFSRFRDRDKGTSVNELTINIDGAGDPEAVAVAAVAEMDRQLGTYLRARTRGVGAAPRRNN